tara:strand:+ start:58842 stop:59702 length:861 start_codon:yes stop_codon:yes gene_type:complete
VKITNPPQVDDLGELQHLANQETLGSYPALMNSYIVIKTQYEEYEKHEGDPWKLDPIPLDNNGDKLSQKIKGHYNQPPQGSLNFIPKTRYELPTLICLMCGGFGLGTLDHYLPKDIYPEFSLLSKNLVPACNCNSLRGTAHRGTATPQRVIHPYFDQFIGDQLYQAKFDGAFESPRISIVVIDENHPNFQTIKFHLENVILNDSTQGWFEKYWGQLLVRPERILKLVLPKKRLTKATLSLALTDYKEAKDDEYDTPNNWFSMFYSGLIADLPRVRRLAEIINRRRA